MTIEEQKELVILQTDVKYIKKEIDRNSIVADQRYEEAKKTHEVVVTLNSNFDKLTSTIFNTEDRSIENEDGIGRAEIRLTKNENKIAIGYGLVLTVGGFIGYWFSTLIK